MSLYQVSFNMLSEKLKIFSGPHVCFMLFKVNACVFSSSRLVYTTCIWSTCAFLSLCDSCYWFTFLCLLKPRRWTRHSYTDRGLKCCISEKLLVHQSLIVCLFFDICKNKSIITVLNSVSFRRLAMTAKTALVGATVFLESFMSFSLLSKRTHTAHIFTSLHIFIDKKKSFSYYVIVFVPVLWWEAAANWGHIRQDQFLEPTISILI